MAKLERAARQARRNLRRAARLKSKATLARKAKADLGRCPRCTYPSAALRRLGKKGRVCDRCASRGKTTPREAIPHNA